MADKSTRRSSDNSSNKNASRSAAASVENPARTRRKAGNPGFRGYQYQIEVTIWVALDLMLAKGASEEVVIEPRSEEDLEAAVKDSSVASLGLTSQGEQFDLILQAKTRSRSPWTPSAIADVLLGQDPEEADKSGKRSRPLAMLHADAKRRYVFVSNEASAEGLRSHEGTHLFDFPEVNELPFVRGSYDASTQASLAARILLLTGVTREVLASRIATLLSQHGHVPLSKHQPCLRDFRDAVRQRIEGAYEGRWRRSEVTDVLVRHGGSLAPTRDMDHYIRPKSFDTIKERLDTAHAVVIAGPSGTGKTLTAEILELGLRRGTPVFDVVGEENGPGYIRGNLTRTDPVLFHLRDPWGGNRIMPGADRWSGELPKLLDNAGPARKFLITSRSDVLLSAGRELMKELRPYVVSIEVEDYGPKRLADIYDGIAADLSDHAKQLSRRHRARALRELTRPYEVKRFLVALSREDRQKPRKIEAILADSQIEAISNVIAEQISPLGADGAEAAAIIWAMLSARGAVSRDVLAKLGRRLRSADPNLRPDIDGLIDFLVAGQNLRKDGAALAFYHPRVEDGLRLTFMRRPRDAEHALSATVDALLTWDRGGEDFGLETGLNVLRATARIGEIQLELSATAKQRLDRYLEAAVSSAEKRGDFERALQDLQQFGSEDHPPASLAKILVEGGLETEEDPVFRKRWRAPPLSEEEASSLRNDSRTQRMIERFVREVLPFSHREYHPELITLLERLATDLQDAFWDALDMAADPGGPHDNISVLVAGALRSAMPDYDRAIDRFARSEGEADAWMKGFADDTYMAEEHAVDADAADHIFEEPGERYFNGREGMKTVVRLRRANEGVEWIAASPHRKLLLSALGELIAQARQPPQLKQLRFLLANSDDWVRDQAWHAAEQHWDTSLRDILLVELARSDIEKANQRRRLVKIAAANDKNGDPVPDLLAVLPRAPFARRLEMVHDVFMTNIEGDPRGADGTDARRARADRLLRDFGDDERELARSLLDMMAGTEISAAASALSEPGRNLVGSTLAGAPIDLSGPLACLAAGAGLDIDEVITRLLSTDDAADGEVAIQAMLIADVADLRAKLRKAFEHRRYKVRRRALQVLATDAAAEERTRLVAAAGDHSSDVRLAFAELMEEYCWPEALDALVNLLGDTRNFASHLGVESSWSKFNVARAAARALGAYPTLPVPAVDALLRAAQPDGDDPFVACAALSALATKDDPRIVPLMLSALESQDSEASVTHRSRAQAAAWGVYDRTVSDRMDVLVDEAARVAERAEPIVAGPLLVAFGVYSGRMRDDLLKRLRAARQHDREALVRTSAIGVEAVAGMSLDDREKALLRLSRGEPIEALSDQERASTETWSQGLDPDSEFGSFIAWIIAAAFKLPLNGKVRDLRAFDLPERIGVMTMRSFSPFREEDGGRADDGR